MLIWTDEVNSALRIFYRVLNRQRKWFAKLGRLGQSNVDLLAVVIEVLLGFANFDGLDFKIHRVHRQPVGAIYNGCNANLTSPAIAFIRNIKGQVQSDVFYLSGAVWIVVRVGTWKFEGFAACNIVCGVWHSERIKKYKLPPVKVSLKG